MYTHVLVVLLFLGTLRQDARIHGLITLTHVVGE